MRSRLHRRDPFSAALIALLLANCASSSPSSDPPKATATPASAPVSVAAVAPAATPAHEHEPSAEAVLAAAKVSPHKARALLIGINEYATLPDLRGALNDVESLRQTLITRMGFAPDRITVLVDAQATRAGILAALKQIVAQSQPDEFIYIHYSGHGSQAHDANGDEDDGRDETLVPQDGRTPGVKDITDDELSELLADLKAKDVLVVLDSCHSGTATRSIVATRAVPMDDRDSLYEGTATRAIVPIESQYVLMTAASRDQKALDGPVDGRSHGLFSYALTRSLGEGGIEATPRAVLSGVQRELERVKAQLGLRDMPEPQLEGPPARIDRALIVVSDAAPAAGGGAAEPARLPFVEASAEGSGRVLLRNGVALGAMPKSTWAIYPPGETEFAAGKALADAVVTEVRGKDAVASLSPAETSVAAGSRAIALSPPPPPAGLTVGWLGGPADARARVESAIKGKLPDVKFVTGQSFARYLLELSGDKCKVFGADGVYLVEELPAGDEVKLAGELARIFGRSMTTSELLALDNQAAGLVLDIRVASRPETRDSTSPSRALLVVADTTAPEYRIRKSGEPRTETNSLQLAVRATSKCYLTLIDVDSEGTVLQLFPNPLSEKKGYYPDGLIEADQLVLVPDSLSAGNKAGFHVDYAPPSGTDTVRGFCVTSADTAHALRDAIGSIATKTRGLGSRGDDVKLGELMRASFGGLRGELTRVTSRGLALVASDEAEAAPATAVATAKPESGGSSEEKPKPSGDGGSSSANALTASSDSGSGAGSSGSGSSAVAAAATATTGAAPDWTATSLTIHVQP
jgi:hypothetical protein